MRALSYIPTGVVNSVNTAIERCISKAFGVDGTENQKELELVRQHWFRDLRTPEFRKAVNQAAKENDVEFFQKLGKVLGREPTEIPQPFPEEEDRFTVESALIRMWLPGEQPSAGFCEMSDPLISQCLDTLLDRKKANHLKPDTVRKTWERLGLQKVEGKLLTRKSDLPSGPADLPPWEPDDLIRPKFQPIPKK